MGKDDKERVTDRKQDRYRLFRDTFGSAAADKRS